MSNDAIIEAARDGNIEHVKSLVEQPGVDPSKFKFWATCIAAEAKHWDIVKFLLTVPCSDDGNETKICKWAIRFAVAQENMDMVQFLAQKIPHDLDDAIHEATRVYSRPKVAEYLKTFVEEARK